MKALQNGIGLSLVVWLFIACPLLADLEPECVDPPPADAAPPVGGPFTCPNMVMLTCDLAINDSVSGSEYTSDDLRINDPVDTASPPLPKVVYDSGSHRFYLKLYSRFHNVGGVPALVTAPVTVEFSYKATTDPLDTTGSFTLIDTYTMNLPDTDWDVGALFPGEDHVQQKAICWLSAPDSELPRRFMLRAEITWAGTTELDTDNNVAFSYYDLTEAKPAADIGLALDLSGSMGSLQRDSGGRTKLEVAIDRAREFIALIEDGDRLGVYAFATGEDHPNTDFFETYRDPDNNLRSGTFGDTSEIFAPADVTPEVRSDALDAVDDDLLAQGCTPVGQGLLRAKDGFAASGSLTKSIVLFSDGLQNVRPFVNQEESFDCTGTGPTELISAEHTFAAQDIRVYSIFFGHDWGYGLPLMEEIKTLGSDLVFGTSSDNELAAAYYSIRNLLDDLLYLEEEGRTAGPGAGPPFSIRFDSAATRGTIGIAWPVGSGADLTVEGRRQGESAWQRFDPRGQPEFRPTPDDAHRVLRFTPGPDTVWELRVVQLAPRVGQVDYALAVYSDVEAARLRLDLGSDGFEAGQPLPIFADLRRAGHPIPGARVEASVRVPARGFGTTLRRYAGRFSVVGTPDTGALSRMTSQLRSFLEKEGKPSEIYPYRRVLVTLRDDGQGADTLAGDGIYSGLLRGEDTRVAGDYQVTVTATGTTPSGFSFERVAKLGTIASVGPADPERSEIRTVVGQPGDDGLRRVTLTVLPTDRFGNAAFPGSGSAIAVRARPGGGALLGDLADNLDSTFSQTILLEPGQELAVEVAVGGVVIGDAGPVEPRPPFHRHEASFHLGRVEPHGRFGSSVDGGPDFSLDWTYRFNRHLAVRTELGLGLFDERFADGELELVHLVPYFQYRKPGGVWVPYFEAGLGFADLENAGSAADLSAGVGAQRVLSSRWRLDFNVHRHRVGGSLDLSYSRVAVGVLYTF